MAKPKSPFFVISRIMNRTAKYPEIAATSIERIIAAPNVKSTSNAAGSLTILYSSNTSPPRIAGIDIRKEKSAALLRSIRIPNAPAIVEPERETPGSTPIACIPPMTSASFVKTSSPFFCGTSAR